MHTARATRGREILLVISFALAATLFLGIGTEVQAGTFAQFHEATGQGNVFLYTNEKSTLGDAIFRTTASVPVVFNYQSISLPPDLQGNQAAHLTIFTSSTTKPVVTASGFLFQGIDGSGTVPVQELRITRDTPANEGNGTRTLLLDMIFTGTLLGKNNTTTAHLDGDTPSGDTVIYSSDFLAFPAGQFAYSLTISGIVNLFNGMGLQKDPNGYYRSFNAAGSGSFDATPPPQFIPEPSTVVLAGIGLMTMVGFVRYRRRTKVA